MEASTPLVFVEFERHPTTASDGGMRTTVRERS